jgi:hypothetical protein
MVLVCDVVRVETCFGPFGDTFNLDARQVRSLRRTYHKLINHFWMQLNVLLGDVDHVEAHLDPFGDSFNLGAR